MKYAVFAIVIMLCGSCKIYKAVKLASNSSLKVNTTNRLYFTDAEKSRIRATINGQQTDMLFDLGANTNLVANLPSGIDRKKAISGTATGIDGKKAATMVFAADRFETAIFNWSAAPFAYSDMKKETACGQTMAYNLLGAGMLQAEQPLLLNYEEGYIQYVDDAFDHTGYTAVKAKFSGNGLLYIALKINGTEHFFLFDTGNSLSMILTDADATASSLQPNYELESYTVNYRNEASVSASKAYKNIPVTLSDSLTVKFGMATQSAVPASNAGLRFIKNFNWLIDRKNNKVYCRLINKDLLDDAGPKPEVYQLAGIMNNTLLIAGTRKHESRYHIGDKIVSVQHTAVSGENMCNMVKLLNTSYDWDTLQVVTESSSAYIHK